VKDFSLIPDKQVLYRDEYFFIIEDSFPVSPGHLLIISNRVVTDYFKLSKTEQSALHQCIRKAKEIIENKYKPDGYNIGMNCGSIAGQTVMHFHCHVIPRYKGDMSDPRGGVRGVIPEKMKY
jgi:diadenosine tetraphosphate (Ap4A) HIT family hydrolase